MIKLDEETLKFLVATLWILYDDRRRNVPPAERRALTFLDKGRQSRNYAYKFQVSNPPQAVQITVDQNDELTPPAHKPRRGRKIGPRREDPSIENEEGPPVLATSLPQRISQPDLKRKGTPFPSQPSSKKKRTRESVRSTTNRLSTAATTQNHGSLSSKNPKTRGIINAKPPPLARDIDLRPAPLTVTQDTNTNPGSRWHNGKRGSQPLDHSTHRHQTDSSFNNMQGSAPPKRFPHFPDFKKPSKKLPTPVSSTPDGKGKPILAEDLSHQFMKPDPIATKAAAGRIPSQFDNRSDPHLADFDTSNSSQLGTWTEPVDTKPWPAGNRPNNIVRNENLGDSNDQRPAYEGRATPLTLAQLNINATVDVGLPKQPLMAMPPIWAQVRPSATLF